MALSYSFIIQNEFLYSIKNNAKIKPIWPIKLKGMGFGKVHDIQTELQNNNLNFDIKSHRMYSLFYHHLYNEHVTITSKYQLLQEHFNNCFIGKEQRETFLDYFCKFQKIYFGFCKLAFIFKLKNRKADICYDLSFNEITEKSKNVLTILLDNRKYLFTLTDIVNMFQNALTKMNFMMTIPSCVKNPFTNNPFPFSILYTMYFFLKSRMNMMPQLIDGYFRCNFNLKRFMMLYDNYIQDFALENFVKTSPPINLLDGLCTMLSEENNKSLRPYEIHPRFPENVLLSIMKPYLVLYFKSKYSRSPELNDHNADLLKKRLKEFFNFNPKFGILEKTLPNGEFIFNTKHIPLSNHSKPKQSVMSSHVNFYGGFTMIPNRNNNWDFEIDNDSRSENNMSTDFLSDDSDENEQETYRI